MAIINEDLTLNGALVAQSITGPLDRSNIVTQAAKAYPLELMNFRVWDAFQTVLGAASSDDLGVTAGAFGTGCPYIVTRELGTDTQTAYARTMFTLPPEYVDASDLQIRFAAGMLTAVSDTTATVDVEIYKSARTTLKTGSDLVTTNATSINSLTFAEKTFSVTGSGLTSGSVLDIRIAIAITDAATAAVYGAIAHAEVLLSIKG